MSVASVRTAAAVVNKALLPLGIKVIRAHDRDDPEQFLPLQETLAGARECGMSVGDYVDVTYNVAGATQESIDFMAGLGVFSGTVEAVCEIGPGTGRYLEKIIRLSHPSHYEIYETARPWADYLVETYGVVSRPTDSASMGSTPQESMDLVHANKVFVVTTFLTTCSYWFDMIKSTRTGGYISFDIVTEDCMPPDILRKWLGAGVNHGPYPAIIPRSFAIKFFNREGADLLGSTKIPMRPGVTELFVFRKSSAAAA